MLVKRFLGIKKPKFGVYDKPAASFAAGLFLEFSRLKSAFLASFALFVEKAQRAFYHFCLSGEIKNGEFD